VPRCPLPSPKFIGREKELKNLTDFFSSDGPGPKVFVMKGMGGCGKSQIAFQFFHHHILELKRYDPSMVFFIDATTKDTLEAGFLAIAAAKGIESTVDDTLLWLANADKPFFLLMDNADDPELEIRKYMPRSTEANVLVTTRYRPLGDNYASGPEAVIDLAALREDEALNLLVRTAGLPSEATSKESVRKLVIDLLFCHALAVVQAGAGMRSMHLPVEDYTAEFLKLRTALIDGETDGVTREALAGYPDYLSSTWILNYRKLPQLSKDLLSLCSHLHHTGITEEIFRRAYLKRNSFTEPSIPFSTAEDDAQRFTTTTLTNFSKPDASWDTKAFRRCTNHALSFSLLNYDEATKIYSIHPLIHDGLQRIAVASRLAAAFLVIRSEEFQAGDRLKFSWMLVPHLESVLSTENKVGVEVRWHPDLGSALCEVMTRNGSLGQAEALQRDVLEQLTKAFGEDHPKTIRSLSNLAATLHDLGRLDEGDDMERQVLVWKGKVWRGEGKHLS
jgi:hypothetical protein